ncbi:hypothetical protein [Emticicia sp. 17c]|uniref:hypothetical protein n=1 Tax=Emticicia sp. 17c TaxID=3127704 RepID=UPI00301C0D02
MEKLKTSPYDTYVVKGFQYKNWETVLNLSKPSITEDFTGTSSYLAKLNIYMITRQQFLSYLKFFSSYSITYQQMHDEYYDFCLELNSSITNYLDKGEYKDIINRYNTLIKSFYGLVKKSSIPSLEKLYKTFFKNYEYFKNFRIGYSCIFKDKKDGPAYYANTVGSKYPIITSTPGLFCVEFNEYKSLVDNFRLYPFIPLDVNPDNPVLKLAIFGNEKWVSPVQFMFPYRNSEKPNYKFSVNSFEISKSIKDLNIKVIEDMPIEIKVDYYYFNGRLYPASSEKTSGFLTIYQQTATKETMRGIPLFDFGPEWVAQPM